MPDSHEINDTLGWVYYQKDMANFAIRPLETSVEQDPKNPIYHFHLGLAYAKTGDTAKARKSLESALKLRPDFPGANDARTTLASLKTSRHVAVAVGTPAASRSASAADSESGVASRLLLLLVGAGLIALYTPTVRWLVDRWTMSVWHNAHGFMIPPAVAYFAWQELKPLRDLPRSSSAWGFMFLIPALLMHVLDTGIHSQILSAVSMVVALPGLSLLFLGLERTKAIAFPLAFSAFMLPDSAGDDRNGCTWPCATLRHHRRTWFCRCSASTCSLRAPRCTSASAHWKLAMAAAGSRRSMRPLPWPR